MFRVSVRLFCRPCLTLADLLWVLQRLSARAAATICQLILWAPKGWLAAPPTHVQVSTRRGGSTRGG